MDPPADETPASRFLMNIVAGIGQALADAPIPAFMGQIASSNVTDEGRAFIERSQLPFLSGGIRIIIPALGKLATWTEQYQNSQKKTPEPPLTLEKTIALSTPPTGSWSEHRARTLLTEYGIPTIPAMLAINAEQAIQAAQTLGFPVALKIVSPDILHKSDIGGVRLGVSNATEVREAFVQIMDAARAIIPAPQIEGILVSPMRSGGVEMLVGVTRDESWGQVLAVGMGGIWVEVLKDTRLRVLPVSRAEIHTMLTELQGARLLQGARGTQAANMEKLVESIAHIAELAQGLKANLESLEINPLWVNGSQIEALDAVITWQKI
jgi:acyl-CoA synthetase (NDP forming)